MSLGVGVRLIAPIRELPGDVRFDLHTQLSVLPESVTTKDDPSDFIGDYRAGGHIWNVGMTTSVGF